MTLSIMAHVRLLHLGLKGGKRPTKKVGSPAIHFSRAKHYSRQLDAT